MEAKVLIAEAERNSCFILGTTLENCRCHVEMVATGAAALEKIKTGKYDLLFLDQELPEVDALQVLKDAKLVQPEINVIVITANGSIDAAVQAIKAGAIDYLVKPFATDKIEQLVSKLNKRESDDINYINDYSVLIGQAKTFMTKGDYNEAQRWLRKAMAVDPCKPRAFNLLGIIYENEKQLPQAQKFFRAAIALDPTYNAASENLQRTVRWGYTPNIIVLGEEDFPEMF